MDGEDRFAGPEAEGAGYKPNDGGNGNGHQAVALLTPDEDSGQQTRARQQQKTQPTLQQRQTSTEKRKRIDQLVKELFEDAQRAVGEDPNEAIRLYKQAEYIALSEGRNVLGRTYVRVGQVLGYISFETVLKKEKSALDTIVRDYRKSISEIQRDMNSVSARVNELKGKRDKQYELADIIKSEKADEEKSLVEMNDKYQTLKKGDYTKETIRELERLREEARQKKDYIASLEEKETENAIAYQNVLQEIQDAESQRQSLRDQMDKTKIAMYDKMKHQTPTTYLMRNIKSLKIASQTDKRARAICQRINRVAHAARQANTSLELASYQSALPGEDDQPAGNLELQQRRDAARQEFDVLRKDIKSSFEEARHVDYRSDSLI